MAFFLFFLHPQPFLHCRTSHPTLAKPPLKPPLNSFFLRTPRHAVVVSEEDSSSPSDVPSSPSKSSVERTNDIQLRPSVVVQYSSDQPVTAVSMGGAIIGFKSCTTRGCKTCGREEIEIGCNGKGRIQGGIATVPGFGWWPIKAYRPCPGFVASGGRYRRRGQSMDEVAFGRGEIEDSLQRTDGVESSKTEQGSRRLKG